MDIVFDKEYLKDLYFIGKSNDKKHRFQPEIIKAYKRCIDRLIAAPGIETLYRIHALNYEVLSGDKAGISSVRINDKYRLEFKVQEAQGQEFITVCLILDISNHYR
ncbi:type II toxin-antitoxin system RelE/ParE family toxin [Rikenella microfusus]|uniref:Plasmid maintenance system killer protein n=1 Tax=Rikenella microfusus TaxID=28139 RepID=A0A379MSN8_9BACT|nr:type II toxin-antitoxin system RelE/ParE family toxin [Rikenella microfusus]SUE34535.1 Plasmid maintenance system killer protein [Rikenella microfusus]